MITHPLKGALSTGVNLYNHCCNHITDLFLFPVQGRLRGKKPGSCRARHTPPTHPPTWLCCRHSIRPWRLPWLNRRGLPRQCPPWQQDPRPLLPPMWTQPCLTSWGMSRSPWPPTFLPCRPASPWTLTCPGMWTTIWPASTMTSPWRTLCCVTCNPQAHNQRASSLHHFKQFCSIQGFFSSSSAIYKMFYWLPWLAVMYNF